MGEYDLNYFVRKEQKGTIFAKISKSSSGVRGKGGFFPYQDYVGKVIECKSLEEITVLPIELTVNYFHYGDNLTIFSFSRLNEVRPNIVFEVKEDENNKGCFNVNTVWVKEVKNLRDVDTIKYLLSFPTIIENLKVIGNSAASHLESRGFDESAQYLKSQIKKLLL